MQIWALVKYNAHPAKEPQLNTNVPFSLGQAQAQTLARDPVAEYAPAPAANPYSNSHSHSGSASRQFSVTLAFCGPGQSGKRFQAAGWPLNERLTSGFAFGFSFCFLLCGRQR